MTRNYAWGATNTDQTVTETQYLDNALIGTVTNVVNAEGERKSLTYPSARELTFICDGLHRVVEINWTDSGSIEYDYKGYYLNSRTTELERSLVLNFDNGTELGGYDAFGRIVWMQQTPPTDGPPQDENVTLAYGYDTASNPLWREDLNSDARDELYGYDALHRLVSFQRGNLTDTMDDIENVTCTQAWTLDKLGNWAGFDDDGTEHDRRFGPANENVVPCTSPGYAHEVDGLPRDVMHDAAGNLMVEEFDDGSAKYRHTYDYRNRRIKLEKTYTGAYWTVANYHYDGLNRHLGGSGGGICLYDGWRVLEEREWYEGYGEEKWQSRRQFIYGERYIDERLVHGYNIPDDPYDGCTDKEWIYGEDRNWNLVVVMQGDWVWSHKLFYEPYGTYTVVNAPQGSGEECESLAYTFQGRPREAYTGLFYFRNRWYRPELGRFMQRDPTGYLGSDNLYEFAYASPTAYSDPLGLQGGPTDYQGIDPREGPVEEQIRWIREGDAQSAKAAEEARRYQEWLNSPEGREYVREYRERRRREARRRREEARQAAWQANPVPGSTKFALKFHGGGGSGLWGIGGSVYKATIKEGPSCCPKVDRDPEQTCVYRVSCVGIGVGLPEFGVTSPSTEFETDKCMDCRDFQGYVWNSGLYLSAGGGGEITIGGLPGGASLTGRRLTYGAFRVSYTLVGRCYWQFTGYQ